MKLRQKVIHVPEGLKWLEVNQFLQIANFFGVNIVDKNTEVLTEDGKVDPTKVKMRRDFDVMETEIIEQYNALTRKQRRQIDRIFSKIVNANHTARNIIYDKVSQIHTAGQAQIGEVMKSIAEGDENGEI